MTTRDTEILKDENEQQFVFHLWQGTCGPTTDSTLAGLALQGLVRRIERRIGGSKCREQTRKLCARQAGRGRHGAAHIYGSMEKTQ